MLTYVHTFMQQRQEYSQLQVTGEEANPVEVVKLFLLGDIAAGKTTMKKALKGVRRTIIIQGPCR